MARAMRGWRSTESNIELDLGRYELRRFGRRVKLEKKPMELLIFLVARREQLVSRKDIIKKLWRSDLFIDADRNLNNIVRKIRTVLGDDPAKPRFVETVVGKGYRFVGPLRVVGAQYASPGPGQNPERENTSYREERSSLAVLPLLHYGKAADEGLSLGIADALVSRLGNLDNVDVLPISAVVDLPPDTPAEEVASRVGVRFVVRGAIQLAKGQWQLSIELFDANLQGSSFSRKSALDLEHLADLETDIAKQIAGALNRPLGTSLSRKHPRFSKDPLAYAEFMRGYRLNASGDPSVQQNAVHHLTNAVTRDPGFALAHATLSVTCATRHFESDPANVWLEKAEFHCRRALETDPELPEGYVARAFLLWGPSKNFQHIEAIADLKRGLELQKNLPHAYNRLGTILAHIGQFDHAREMYERGRSFHPQRKISPSIAQVYVWNQEYELARELIQAWRNENPGNRYAIYFAPQPALMADKWDEAELLIDEALELMPEESMIISLRGVLYALTGKEKEALECITKACAIPRSFGHLHHTYYQIACILALLGRAGTAFEWLERSVGNGFACWPLFLKDRCLQNLRGIPEFELLVSSLQSRFPETLGQL
jgi:DNA-binding winged helix-turn-helix (wHTH) protein/tetratricopeptide (TPR) repeat protein